MLKVLTVVAEATTRDKKSLGDKVTEAVNAFLESPEGGTLDSVNISQEFSTGTFGRALVSVIYSPHKEVKKEGKK